MYVNNLIICAILLMSGYFLRYYNKPQIIDKREDKSSLDQLKLMKDIGYIFFIFGWIYLFLAALYIFLPNINLVFVENLLPYLFLISILALFITKYKKNKIYNFNRILILIGIITLIIFGFNIASAFILVPNEISVNNTNLTIKGIYGMVINIDDVDRVEYAESILLFKKLSGIKISKTIKGEFIESNLGEVTAFLENEKNVVIVFLKNDKIICINFKEETKTEIFYGILKSKLKK